MRPTKQELEQRWWHRLFKVARIVLVLAVLAVTGFATVSAMNRASRTEVPQLTLTTWAYQRITAIPQGMMIGVAEFRKDSPRGTYIGCQTADGIRLISRQWTDDAAASCALADKSPEEHAAFLERNFPEYRSHVGDGVVCNVPREACWQGEVVRYSRQSVYKASHYAGVVLIPLASALAAIGLLNLIYYRMILYVVFGKEAPPATTV